MLAKICPVCKTEYGAGEVFCPNDGTRLSSGSQAAAPPPKVDKGDPLLGAVIDERYRIVRRIGEGGMGIVYEVEHVVIEKHLALKVLRDDYSSRPEVVARFRQEAKSASRIGNEHIVDISDFGETPNGASYFVMELLDGEDLANVLAREGTLPLSRAADILTQCGRALAAAHAKGIVHRDMKPENIFLTKRDGRPDFVKIVDFGIAKMSDIETEGQPGRKLTKTGMIFGTPEYMSPEQAAGKSLDHRVDIYALGVIFFELITGRVPFSGDTFMGVLTQHMFEAPPSLLQANPAIQVPDSIEVFMHRALAKDPGERFQTCEELIAALDKAVRGVSLSTPPPVDGRSPATGKSTKMGYGETFRPAAPTSPQTLPIDEGADASSPSKPSNALLFVGLGLVTVALAGGGWYFLQHGATPVGTSPDPTTTTSAPPDAYVAIPDAFVAPPDAATPEDAGPEMVSVGVVTTPSGARVEMLGSEGIACESTPCNLSLPLGQHVQLQAHLRNRSQVVEVDVVRDMAPISIRIRTTTSSGTDGQVTDPGDGMLGPLKIPDALQGGTMM
ncbi:MAG: protein kinase [Sandaracinaceae bacterium]|nr:protein kinase [Sandaracinaceae bacterium]